MVEISLFIFTDIVCPDYGVLKIYRVIPSNVLSKFLEIQLDLKKAFRDLICSIVEDDSFDFSKLTEKDQDYIAQEIARLHGVELQYLNSRELKIPRTESLSGALKESLKVKNIKNLMELMKPLSERSKIKTMGMERFSERILRNEKKIKEMMEVQSGFQEMGRELMRISSVGTTIGEISKIGKSIEGVLEVGKTLGGIAGTINTIKILSIGKMLGDHIQKQSLELHKISLNIVPKLSISKTLCEVYQSRMNAFVQNISSIGETLKPISVFLSNTKEAFGSFENIGNKISTFREPIELTNSTLMKSREIVSGAHDHFSRIDESILEIPRPPLPTELREYEEELIGNNEEAEELLHFEASGSISISNKLVIALESQIRSVKTEVQNLRNEIKEYGPLLTRMNILSNQPSILEFLRKIVRALSEKYWEIFWVKKGDKFVSRPERLIKSHLGLGIELGFGDIAFIGPEIKIGNGYIDLFVNFLGISYIIEFKIVGPGWGIGWAKSGINQLDHYMHIHSQNESYLVVLDGRKTDRGAQLENEYECENGKVYVITSKIFWS